LVKPHERLALGARFLSGQRVKISERKLESEQIPTGLSTRAPLPGLPAGTPLDVLVAPAFASGGALSTGQRVSATLVLPAQVVVGGAIRVSRAVTLLADYQFSDWSAFDTLELRTEFGPPSVMIEDFQDSHGIRVGVEYAASDRTIIRGGVVTSTAGAPDQTVTPLLPEASRLHTAAGLGRQLTGRLWLDLYYLHLFQDDRRGRTSDLGMAVPTTAANKGLYSFRANVIGLSLVIRFDRPTP
jgi:long-chain fatty acid transport protein